MLGGNHSSTFANVGLKTAAIVLVRGAQVIGASFHAPKGCRFDSWSGHIPRLQVQSPVRTHIGGYTLMILFFSFSLSSQ